MQWTFVHVAPVCPIVQVVASGIMANPTADQREQLSRFNGTIASVILDKTRFLSAPALLSSTRGHLHC